MKRSHKYYIYFALIFFWGFIVRSYMGLYFPTEDLAFYVDLNTVQLTRLGLEKQLLFYPLLIFDAVTVRIIALAAVQSLLYALVILSIIKSSRTNFSSTAFILSILSFFHFQIDMHLVRQQIALYLFLLAIFGSKRNVIRCALLLAAFAYHEAAIILFCSYAFAKIIGVLNIAIKEIHLGLIAILLEAALFVKYFHDGILLLILISISIYLAVNFKNIQPLNKTLYWFVVFLFTLDQVGYLSVVSMERLIGVAASLGLLVLIAFGNKNTKNFKIKEYIKITLFISYGGFFFVTH